MSSQAHLPYISQLFVYPVKSCAGISVTEIRFDDKGPLFDRRWMLVDAQSGLFLSQREISQMALISTRIEDGEVWVGQSFNLALAASCQLPRVGELVAVKIWDDCVRGYDCGDEMAAWFSQLLDRDCRLVYQGDCERLADEKYADSNTGVSFADGFPLLVVAQASIDVLKNASKGEVSSVNFRPNIVVDNTPAFAEKSWKSISVGQHDSLGDYVKMTVVKRCQRCVIPMLNPYTAKRDTTILPVLLEYCREGKEIYFGQNLTFQYSANLALEVGHSVLIDV